MGRPKKGRSIKVIPRKNLSNDPKDLFPAELWDMSPERRLGKCKGITAFGYPCQNRYLVGEDYCMMHHPDREKMQKEREMRYRSKLGKWRAALPSSLAHIVDQIVISVLDVRRGTLDPEKAKAVSALVEALPSVIKAARELYELKEMHRNAGSKGSIIDIESLPSLEALKNITYEENEPPKDGSNSTT